MAFRLVAVDIDDTLLGRDGRLLAEHVEAIRSVRSRGVQVTLATGRRWPAARPVASELGLDGELICCFGALIVNAGDGTSLAEWPLPVDAVRELAGLAGERGIVVSVVTRDRMVFNRLPDRDPPPQGGEVVVDPGLAADVGESVYEAVVVGEQACRPVEAWARGRLDVMVTAYPVTQVGRVVYLHRRGADKGAALCFLAGRLGMERGEVLAIGDGPNDVPMLAWAGVGVAVGWADAQAKAAADVVLDAADPAPVATALRRWVLEVDGGCSR